MQMCKRKLFSTAKRPSTFRSAELELPAPYIPLADPVDGLIKTEDLRADVIVQVTVWEGAKPNDSLHLTLNGLTVGAEFTLDAPIEGAIIELKIPVDTALTNDGLYKVKYVTRSFPGGNTAESLAIDLKVDRTAPGAHQLGYMDFPDEAKDGLTAVELEAMGNTLTGRIYGYTGLTSGDTIFTYWGNIPGPEILLTGNEDGDTPIEVPFGKEFLILLGNNPGATSYKIKDRAGNLSAPSREVTIPLFLTEVITDLAPPVIESYDGLIDYSDALSNVNVGIPSAPIFQDGDQVLLRWGGVSVGPYPVNAKDLGQEFVLVFEIVYSTIAEAGNGSRQLRYDVLRGGQVLGVSETADINVNIELPVPGTLEKPTVKGGSSTPSAEDNLIDEDDFELDATAIINWNDDFDPGESIQIYWAGQEASISPYIITNSDSAAGRPLLLTIKNSIFKPLGTGTDIRVYYTVSQPGNPNRSISAERGIIVRSKDELPGGADGLDAPEFEQLNANGAINRENSENGAPVYIKPYLNISTGQTIVYTYEAYSDLVAKELRFTWTHTSPPLTEENVVNGYRFSVPRHELMRHCYGHAEATFQVLSDKGTGNSLKANAYVDLRVGGVCNA
jgi:hypothetical protein